MKKEQLILFTMYLSSTLIFTGTIFLFESDRPLGYVKILIIFIGILFSLYHVIQTCVSLLDNRCINSVLQKAWYIRSIISIALLFNSAYLVGML